MISRALRDAGHAVPSHESDNYDVVQGFLGIALVGIG